MVLAQLGNGFAPYVERAVLALAPGISPPAPFEELACRLLDLTVAWNAKMDLTAAKTTEELVDLTFADALALFGRGELRASDAWLDVGSGSGAPGLPLALVEPRLAMTLLEPMQKRVAFLRTLVGTLRIGAQVLRGRVEDRPDGSTDVAISRATLPPAEWLREGARIAKREVWVLLAREEAPSSPGWSVRTDFAFEWPLTGRKRRMVGFSRLAPAAAETAE
jgi:16S rRNA (guanine527-N7)-methyltransferase